MDPGTPLVFVGFMLAIAGVLVLLAYLLFRALKSAGEGEGKVAGVVIIGPIPIIFGEGRKSTKLVVALALAGLALTLALLFIQLYLLR